MSGKTRPIHQIQFNGVRAAIWENETEQGVVHKVTVSRSYRKDGEWHSTDSYGRDDLLLLAKAADHAHTWICDQRQLTKD